MSAGKAEPLSTNFDSDAEDGELSSSPKTQQSHCAAPDVMKGTEMDHGDFVVDRTESVDPINESSADSSMSESASAWLSQITSGLLDVVEPVSAAEETAEPPAKRARTACFNCGGAHQLNQCTEPRDQKRIREAANEFKERRRIQESGRYHDDSPSQRNNGNEEFRPGKVSTALREALGIGPDDIPEWIYRMRRMGFLEGYPPAYLKRAVATENSGQTLRFHLIDGEETHISEEQERESPPPVVDAKKIYFYMGFNRTYRSLRDRENNFRVPPFDDFVNFHQKALTDKYYQERNEKRRRRQREKEDREKKRKELEQEGDVVELPSGTADDNEDCIIIDRKPAKNDEVEGQLEPKTPNNTNNEEALSTVVKGTVIDTVAGTPVMVRRNAHGQDVHNNLPSLEAFSKGITPFSATEEPTPHRGFLKRIFAKIKQVTGK